MMHPPSRRAVLKAGAAGLLASTFPAMAQSTDMRDRAARWLGQLDAAQRGEALRDFDDPLRRRWSFMHGSNVAPGLPLERMSGPLQDAAMDLVATALSPEGLETAQNIMLQQDILRDEWGKGRADRNRQRFSLILFGTPSERDLWGWRFEGHHLSLNFTLRGDEVVSVTPNSFCSEPNTVPSGPHEGLVVLPSETMGRQFYAALEDGAARAALLDPASFGNILTTAGNLSRVAAPQGLPVGDLGAERMDQLRELLGVFTTDFLARDLVDGQTERLSEEMLQAARFGWAGPNEAGQSIYYRLHGETFLIEFATLRNQPEHHHAIWHDLGRNFGQHLL